jgi:hypothetical protein
MDLEYSNSRTSVSEIRRSIDISALGKGLFVVKIISNNKTLTKRFVVV